MTLVKPGFDEGEILESFRRTYDGDRYHRLIVPSIFDEDAAASLRSRLTSEELTPFYLADRGRYHYNASSVDEPLWAALRGFAERVVQSPLEPAGARWLRFGRGDYQMIRGDAVERAERGMSGRHLEVSLDFSAQDTDQAETVYSDGAESFVVPQWGQSVALVERVDSLYRYQRYLNHLVGDAEVWRLRLSFRFAS